LAVTGASDTRGGAQWLRVATASNADLTRALTQLRQTHRLDTFALRAL
jgi:hypothetical protein